MDALSHALCGIAVAGLSGHPPNFQDPIYLASIIGAQAPDFDIIAIIRGNFSLLRQHRSFSHSIPGLIMWSSLITVGFFLFSSTAILSEVFFWSFFGGLSHIIIDFFNAHGAAILWPFSRERKSFGLLNVFDPILLTLMFSVFIQQLPVRETSLLFFITSGAYIGIRCLLKIRATNRLKQYFTDRAVTRMLVMPSLKSILGWDFVVETSACYYVGQIGILQQNLTLYTELKKQELSPAVQEAHNTVLGKFFSSFTPFSYITEQQDSEQSGKLVRIYDLRYFLNEDFLHSATIVFSYNEQPCDSYIETHGRKIRVPC